MKKNLSLLKSNIYFFVALFLMLVIGLTRYDSEAGLNDFRLLLYLPDYSLGFCSRFLVGSVLSVFKKTFTVKWLTDFCVCVFIFTAFLTAFLFNALVKKTDEKYRNAVALSGLMVMAMAVGFGYFAYWLGMTDIYWFIFTLLALACLKNRYLRWLFPVFSFLCIANHYMAAIIVFPVFAAVMMMKTEDNPKDKKTTALLVLTIAVSVLSGIYFVFFATKTVTVPMEEAQRYLNSKLAVDQRPTLFYMYGKARYETVNTFSGIIREATSENISEFNAKKFFSFLTSMLPIMSVFSSVYFFAFKKANHFPGKITCVLCVLFNIVPFAVSVVSSDYIRWFSLLVISQTLIILYLVYDRNEAICEGFGKISDFFAKNPVLLAAFGYITIIYASRI